jgi:hypothetical protein
MRSRTKTAVVALAGAVALSSAAYGIGTQVGGGTASAGDGDERGVERGFAFGGPPPGLGRRLHIGFDGLADELGVDAGELREALEDFSEQRKDDPGQNFAAALAKALDKPVEDVEAALDDVAPREPLRGRCLPRPPFGDLAEELGVSKAELREALRELRPEDNWKERHDELARFLAERFDLSRDEVEEALPEPPPHRMFWRDGMPPPHLSVPGMP